MSSGPSHSLSEDQIERFARQIIVPGIGAEGQMRLCAATVFVDGHPEGRRVAIQYLRAAGVRIPSTTTPCTAVDCTVIAGTSDLPQQTIQRLIDAAPLVAWYTLVENRICGGLARAADGLPELTGSRAAVPVRRLVVHRIAGADVAATAVAALLGWAKPGDSYALELA